MLYKQSLSALPETQHVLSFANIFFLSPIFHVTIELACMIHFARDRHLHASYHLKNLTVKKKFSWMAFRQDNLTYFENIS